MHSRHSPLTPPPPPLGSLGGHLSSPYFHQSRIGPSSEPTEHTSPLGCYHLSLGFCLPWSPFCFGYPCYGPTDSGLHRQMVFGQGPRLTEIHKQMAFLFFSNHLDLSPFLVSRSTPSDEHCTMLCPSYLCGSIQILLQCLLSSPLRLLLFFYLCQISIEWVLAPKLGRKNLSS